MSIQKGGLSSRREFLTVWIGALGAHKVSASQPASSSVTPTKSIRANRFSQDGGGPEVSLKGKLKGGLMGVGGETTGYALIEPRLASSSIEVDMSSVREGGKLDGKEILVTGVFQTKEYVERGKVVIFKARSVRNLSS